MMKKFPIIKHSYKRIICASLAIWIALSLFFSNLRPSIQFTWGLEIVSNKDLNANDLEQLKFDLTGEWYDGLNVTLWKKDSLDSILVQWRLWSNEEVVVLSEFVKNSMIDNNSISTKDDIEESSIIWPSIWDNITKTSKTAMTRGTILMALYILFSFAGMRKVISPILLALVTIGTMIFDVAIASGWYGLLMMFNNAIQVDTIFIIALLTVMWYSMKYLKEVYGRLWEDRWQHLYQLCL